MRTKAWMAWAAGMILGWAASATGAIQVAIDGETVAADDWTGLAYADSVLTIQGPGEYVLSGMSAAVRVRVPAGASVAVVASNVSLALPLEVGHAYQSAFRLEANAAVELTLWGTNACKSGYGCAGIQVDEGARLTISERSTGLLAAYGGAGGAGIGGGGGTAAGRIEIGGGRILATGGAGWLGSGVSDGRPMGGAGIGGGAEQDAGTLVVSGGDVIARGAGDAAGIGGGKPSCSNLGGQWHRVGGNGGTVVVSGGRVLGMGAGYGAGLGGGGIVTTIVYTNQGLVMAWDAIPGAGADIALSGGTVMARSGMASNPGGDSDIGTGHGIGLTSLGSLRVSGGSLVGTVDSGLTPTNAQGTAVCRLRLMGLTPGGAYDFTSGLPEGYSATGLVADGNGTVCLWLPAGTYDIQNGGLHYVAAIPAVDHAFPRLRVDGAEVQAGNAGDGWAYDGTQLAFSGSGAHGVSGGGTNVRVVVESGATPTLTLSNVVVVASGAEGACAFRVEPGGQAELTVLNSAFFASGPGRAGVEIAEGGELTVTADSRGILRAGGSWGGAGIGGANGERSGALTVAGGTIWTVGAHGSAAIGAGAMANPAVLPDWDELLDGDPECEGTAPVFAGGSIVATGAGVDAAPFSPDGKRLYEARIAGFWPLESIAEIEGVPAGYATNGIAADADGVVCLWLPEGRHALRLAGRPWEGTLPAGTWYVDAQRPDDGGDGRTRETAKKSLQAAVDAAVAGETIVVLDGAYGPIVATNAIVVRSDNGASRVLIDGGGAARCATLGAETKLVGLTLTNGLAENGGGVHGGILERCVLTGNRALNEGGGAYTGKLFRCVLDGNVALYGGGSAQGQLDRCRLADNRAGVDGGGAHQSLLNDCWLAGNSATNNGGGVCESTVDRSRLSDNAAANGGGGACNGQLWNCRLENNVAGARGGGMYGGQLANCVLTGNSSGTWGGGAESAIMSGCTLWGNWAGLAGGGSAYGRLFNCIAWSNEADAGENAYEANSLSSHNCTAPALEGAGEGNIGVDPLLLMPAEGRFELRAGSPCLNAGADSRAEGATDLAGNERVSAGHAVDMGAFEMPNGAGLHYVVVESAGGTVVALGDRAVADGGSLTFAAEETEGRTFVAFLTNGVFASSQSPFTWENVTASGTLTAVFSPTTFYADASRPDDSGDGRSWATAKRTLQAAVEATLAGDEVRVAPGTYAAVATANRAILVISRDGPGTTRIDGGAAQRCATLGAAASETNTVLAGFTLANGRADLGGGSFGGTLQRCRIVGNAATDEGGGAYGGKLVNCVVSGNESGYVGGGASRAEIVGCTVAGNRAEYGGGAVSSRLYNSIVWGNESVADAFYANVAWADFASSGNCTAPALAEGTNNVCGDPLFLAPADGRFELRTGSPCLNSGAQEWVEGAEDLAGNARLAGPAVDMGAFEMPGGTGFAGAYVALATSGQGAVVADGDRAVPLGASATFTAQETAGRAFLGFYTNGTFATSNALFTWENIAADGTLTAEFEKWTFHVDASRPDDSGDGLSPATAKRTLPAAVAAALGGDAVRVAPGIYGPVATANASLDVRSLEGPEVTVIDGGGAQRCATLGESPAETNTVLAGFTLQNGYAGNGGGACGGTLVQCVLLDNVAGDYGGGAWYGTLRDCVLRGNAANDGGGAYQAALADCTVSGNRASSRGGGAYECSMMRCRLLDNEAGYAGGGSAYGSLSACWLAGNAADNGGGAYGGHLADSVLTGNRADYGGGSCGSDLTGCTVSGNQAGSCGGGTSYGELHNCIVWGNQAREENNAYFPSSSSSFNCTDPVLSSSYAAGNVGGDPRFLAPQEQRFELRAGSPCLNAGDNARAEGAADVAENERIAGGTVDLGAHEMPAGAGFAGHYVALEIRGRGTVDVSGDRAVADGASLTFTASETAGQAFLGFYTNGTFATSNAVFTWENVAADGTLTAEFELATIYADAARPDDAGDGRTWATAKRTLQAAVDAALADTAAVDQVLVAPGLYGPIATPDRKLAIRSAAGADATILSGNGLARCATLATSASGTNTLLSGFTLQDGEAEEGGGAYGGTLEDCILAGNHAWSGGGAFGGRLRRCLLTRNTANMGGGACDEYAGLQVLEDCELRENEAYTGGGTYYGTLSRCRLQDNGAEYGGGAAYSRLRNSVLVGNQAQRGGGAYGGGLAGCTVWGNQATEQGGGADDVDDMALCIVWGNEAPTDPNVANAYGEPVRWSCTEPAQEGEGNFAADPLFLAPADGRFELRAGSPCLDAGADACAVGDRDVDGHARFAGARVDVGAVEMPAGAGFAGLYVGLDVRGNGTVDVSGDQAAEPGASVTFTASETAGRPFVGYYLDGAWATSNKVFTWENVGTDGVVTAEFETWTFHVDAARPDDAGDGRSWATAKRTVQAAVEAARDGEEIRVAAGTYGPIETKNRRLSIRGVDGAAATRLDGGGSNRCANLALLLPFRTNTCLAGFTLTNGYADCGGGAYGGTLTECVLSGNRAEQNGGGAYGGALADCAILGNVASYLGGGTFDGVLEGCVLAGNAAESFGGGTYGGRLNHCELASNTATWGGGAYCAVLSNCLVQGNSATNGGGAYETTLADCRLVDNRAGEAGGGSKDGQLSRCRLTGNQAVDGGGAYGGTLLDCELSGNRALERGGGAQDAQLTDCLLRDNETNGDGGGATGGQLSRCRLQGNVAQEGGGASYAVLENCVLVGNQAQRGGGALECGLAGCTVWGNWAAGQGGGVLWAFDMALCIVWSNEAATDPNVANESGAPVRWSCTEPAQEGEGNFAADPLFLAPADGRFELRAGSPCLDAGADACAVGDRDVDGHARLAGARVDVGAVEMPDGAGFAGLYVGLDVRGNGTVDVSGDRAAEPGASVTFTASETAGRPFVGYYLDGAWATSNAVFTWENVATDGVVTAEFETWTFHVDAARPDDAGDGRSWATAKRTVQAAVEAARDGEEIRVAAGTYGPIETANRRVSIRGVDGAAATRLDGGGSNRCATLAAISFMTNTHLAGFTLTNGYADCGGGAYGGTLTECVVSGNHASSNGGGTCGGVLRNCSVSGNAACDGGGTYRSVAEACAITDNQASNDGGGSYDGQLSRCRLAGNRAGYGGGAARWATLFNCELTGNQAVCGGGASVCRLANCTVTGNTAEEGGGIEDGTTVNSIVWSNSITRQTSDHNWRLSGWDGYAISHTCTTPLPPGTGNVAADPLFIDPGAGNYRLTYESPCRDAGSLAAAPGETDLDGSRRIQGAAPDMGAYEVGGCVLQVVSADGAGNPAPSAGWHGFDMESGSQTATVAQTAVVDACWKGVCTGWSGQGCIPASGSGTAVAFTPTLGLSTLVWNWVATDYWLDVSVAKGNGTTDCTFGWKPAGETAALAAQPAEPGAAAWWTEAGELIQAGTTCQVQMDRPRNLQVWFAQAAVVVHAGRLAGDETWAADAVHLVLGTVFVPPGTSLVIARGAIVKFVPGAGITVESGGCCQAQGAVFTHANDDTAGGDTFLDGTAAKPLVNQYALSGEIRTDPDTDVRFTSQHVSDQETASNVVWMGNRAYHVDKTFTVQSGGRLTIEPGAVVKFGPGAALVVAAGGELQALGSRANPIVFTSRKDDVHGGDSNADGAATAPEMGDYRAIQILGRAAFDHCSFLYGGSTLYGTWSETEGGALVFGASSRATVSNCLIADGRFDGFIAHSSDLIVANTAVRHCDRGCNVLGGMPTMVNCVSYGCRWGWLFHDGMARVANCSAAEFTGLGIYGRCQMENSHAYSSLVPTSSWWATNYSGYVRMKGGAPLFQDPENGDFRLRPGSPLIDAGTGTMAPETDAFGRPRMDDPYVADTGIPGTNGACPDIGIYEMDCANAGSDRDLAVAHVRSPRAAAVGELIRVDWRVVNAGSAAIAGPWRDAVALVSADGLAVQPVGEKLVAPAAALEPGQVRECSALFEVPAVLAGDWFVQVQANAYRDVYEGGLVSNNFGVASLPLAVSMPSLALGEEWSGRAAGGAVLRLAAAAAEAMVARIQAPAGAVVLCGLGFMPTETQYSSRTTCGADGLALITIPAGLTAYLRVLGDPEALGDVAVRTASAALEVARVEPATVPAIGTISLTVQGANFTTNSRIRLAANGTTVDDGHVLYVSSDCLIATVDGAALAPGTTYDVAVVDGGATGTLERAVAVSAAPAQVEFNARLTVPSAVRHMRRMTLQVDYENAGSREMPAPILEIVATGVVFTVGNQAYTNAVELLALAPRSPRGCLAPGASNRLSVAAMMVEPLASVDYVLRARHVGTAGASEPVEWRRLFNEDWVLYPEDGAENAAETDAVRAALQERIGATWADYYDRLGRYVSEAEANGVNVTADYGLESSRFVEALYWEVAAELAGETAGPTSAFRRPTGVRRSSCDHGAGVVALAGDNWKTTPDGAVWAYCRGCRNWVYGWETDPEVRSRYFDPAKSTYLICHGHQNCIGEAWILNMAEALLGVEPDANLLAINWGAASKGNPLPHVTAPALYGVAQKAMDDCRSFLVPERTTLIGHSHGGHVVGFLAALWPAGGTFRRVVGLDTSTCDMLVHAWAVPPQAWIQRIRSRADQVEFYKSSWDLSLEQRDELFGDYNFAVKREGDFFEKRIGFLGGLERHGWAIQWFIDSIVGNYAHKGYHFQGAASWAALSGGAAPEPARDRILGVFRDDVLECLAPVRAGRDGWRYEECLLDGQDLDLKALSSLQQASILSFDYDSSHADPFPTRLRTEGRNACTWLVANHADNRSIPYRDLWNFITRYKPAAPWDKQLGCGAWLVDYETLTNRVPAAAAVDWGTATLADLQDCLAAADADDLVQCLGMVNVKRRDFVLPESLGTYEIPMRVSAKPFGRSLVASNGVSSRLLLAVGAGVDVAGGDLPAIHAGDLEWTNNFRFGLVEFTTGQVCAAMAAERSPGEGRRRLADGASLQVEADSGDGSWSVVIDGRDSYQRLATGATQSVAAWTWNGAGDVAASVAPQGNGDTSRVSGRLPDGVDGARFAVTLTVRGANGEEDSVGCELDVRRECEEEEGEEKDRGQSNTPYSVDPNEMAGPVGITSPSGTRYVAAGDWLNYVVYFENKAEATAAAQMVAVSNALSPYLDWNSLQMGEVVFNNQLDMGLDGQPQGSTETELDGSAYRVRTVLTLDRTNGVAHWLMRIVDDATPDGWPEDPYAGFLPPNDAAHRGEGHLAYRIRVRADAPIGALIPNSATIVFDYNEPIATDPAWWNVVESVVNVALEAGTIHRTDSAFAGIEGHAFGDLPRPEREGYAFDGWWTGAGGTGTRIVYDTVVSPEIQTLYAHWLAENAIFLSDVSDPDENGRVTISLPAAFAGLDVPVAVSSGPDAETGAWTWSPVGTFTVGADGAIAGLPFTAECQFYRIGGAE